MIQNVSRSTKGRGIAPAQHNTPRHLNEATSIDFESAFINHAEAMDACEYVVTAAYQGVAENCITELETLGLRDGFSVPDESFPRISYQEAIERINATGSSMNN
jgi:nondiscriminating aspartyl-tRNA synthetase